MVRISFSKRRHTQLFFKHTYFVWIAVLFTLIALSVSGCDWFDSQKSQKQNFPLKRLILGVETSFLTSAVWIAENKGYFQEQGIDLNIKEFDSGKAALAAMLGGENLDMVTVAQTPVMFNSFTSKDFVIIATMVTSENDVKLLARKDKGIKNPSDLKGKKVGVTYGSTGHFYLGLFLTYIGIEISDIELIDIAASELSQALADGRIDVISTWEPHILSARKLLGNNAVSLLPSGGMRIFREDFYFVLDRDFAEHNPKVLKRFLKAIEKGNNLIKENKDEAITIVSQRLKIERGLVASVWDNFEFQLMIDQSILMILEDEARWAIKSNLTDKKEIPNYLDYIYVDALEAVKPEAVTIIK